MVRNLAIVILLGVAGCGLFSNRAMEDRIDELEDKITALESELEDVKNDVEEAKTTAEEGKDEAEQAQSDVDDLTEALPARYRP